MSSAENPAAARRVQQGLEALFAELLARDPTVPGILCAAHVPALGLDWQAAFGRRCLGAGEALHSGHTFRIASLTKVYTAAAVLRLHEQGALGLDDPVEHHLAPSTVEAMWQAGYATGRISIEHLLAHTSGLPDFVAAPAYQAAVAVAPERRWTRAEQVELALRLGPPPSAPGDRFSYGDTGHVLLGEVIERRSGQPMAAAIRALLRFGDLGLAWTHFESLEPPGDGAPPRAHQYLGSIDTTGFDPSFDLFGGGGLVSNVAEIGRFWRALFRGELFADTRTLERALQVPRAQTDPARASHSLLAAPLPLGPAPAWGHAGHWGSVALHAPGIDATVVLSLQQSAPRAPTELRDLVARVGAVIASECAVAPAATHAG